MDTLFIETMNKIIGAILGLGLALTVVITFWIGLDDLLVHKDDPGVIPAIWILGIVIHAGLLGILYYYLIGWRVIDKNWLKRRKK